MCRASDFGSLRLRRLGLQGMLLLFVSAIWGGMEIGAQDPPVQDEQTVQRRLPPPDPARFPGLKRLQPNRDVWIDAKNKRIVVQAGVCLREGPIEMFACNHQWIKDSLTGADMFRGTKEYESIVTINAPASAIHAGLLAVGAESGKTVQFQPEYKAASGTPIRITLYWMEGDKPRQARAQEWVRNAKTKKALEHDWVFAGSQIVESPETGRKRYLAEDGDVICVSNFPDAMLDLPIESTQVNDNLMFEAFTENVPAIGTTVTIVLEPKPAEKEKEEKKQSATPAKTLRR